MLGLENTRVQFDAFWVDRYEVSNRQYQVFVDAGGYRRPELWQHPFVSDGKTLGFDEAMGLFRDATGRPGPAPWTLGKYPSGEDDLPVTGVSWFEAAAYAAFSGKALPTVYHWYSVASQGLTGFVIPLANFNSTGPVKSTETRALHRYGTGRLAGNEGVVFNRRGQPPLHPWGGWDEPPYGFGIRRAIATDRGLNWPDGEADEGDASVEAVTVSCYASAQLHQRKPVGDEVFHAYERMYA